MRHPLVRGFAVALPLSLLAVACWRVAGAYVVAGAIMVAMSFLTGIAVAYSLRGPSAIVLTLTLTITCGWAAFVAAFGRTAADLGDLVIGIYVLVFSVVGVLFGIIVRPLLRRWFG